MIQKSRVGHPRPPKEIYSWLAKPASCPYRHPSIYLIRPKLKDVISRDSHPRISNSSIPNHLFHNSQFPISYSRLAKQTPILNLERRPDAGRVLDGVADELALAAELQVDLVLVVLALDVGHVDGDEDVRLLLLESQERQDDGGKVGRRGGVAGLVDVGGLCRDEGVRGSSLSGRKVSKP